MNQTDIAELRQILKRLRELAAEIEKTKMKSRKFENKESLKMFASTAAQFKKKVSELR